MDIRVIVVTHKDYEIAKDSIYLPVCVGVGRDSLRGKFQPDDEGENISSKNTAYCELTGVYWAWKNLKADYIGVNHYRRYFANSAKDGAATKRDLERGLEKYDVILPTLRRYPFYTVESHYVKSVRGYEEIHQNDINMLRKAVHDVAPEYSDSLEKTLASSSAHMLNMYVMKYQHFDSYCRWMFSVIDRTAELLSGRKDQRRFAGALSEWLIDVWIRQNGLSYTEMKVYETEKPSFFKHLMFFIKRKINKS